MNNDYESANCATPVTPRGGLYVPAVTSSTQLIGGFDAATPAATVPTGPVKIETVAKSRTVRFELVNAPFSEVSAETDPDTDAIYVTIGCQTHSLQRWRRVGARLIRLNYGETNAKRLNDALATVLDRFGAEFKKRDR